MWQISYQDLDYFDTSSVWQAWNLSFQTIFNFLLLSFKNVPVSQRSSHGFKKGDNESCEQDWKSVAVSWRAAICIFLFLHIIIFVTKGNEIYRHSQSTGSIANFKGALIVLWAFGKAHLLLPQHLVYGFERRDGWTKKINK